MANSVLHVQAQDITDLGSLKEAAKIFVPGEHRNIVIVSSRYELLTFHFITVLIYEYILRNRWCKLVFCP